MKYLIVENGPFLTRDVMDEIINKNEFKIIALDGAARKPERMGFKPDIIMGDFDSITKDDINLWSIPFDFLLFSQSNNETKILGTKFDYKT